MIQRSADGRTFRNAGWVESKAPRGNSTNTLNYSFSDGEAITGTTYYKLQQTDIDGKTTWSDILPLSAGNDASFTVLAAPNPVSQKLSLTTLGTQGRNATISVADITGKQVKTIVVTGNETEIDMSSLSRGMYLIRYQDDNHIQTIKVTRQ